MLSSVGIQSVSRNHSPNCLFAPKTPQNQIFPTLKNTSVSIHPKKWKLKPSTISASSAQESDENKEKNEGKKKLGVVVKAMERPRVALRFIWMERNIGIAIDQVIPGGRGTIPLSPYYFWPRRDAWEELKVTLESKRWISHKQIALLLNQATDIINLWQQSGGRA